MNSSNYGSSPKYDQNSPLSNKDSVKNKKGNHEDVEAIITEEIVRKKVLEVNIYEKHYGNDKYTKSETYSIPLEGYEELMLKDLLDMSRFFPAKHLHIESMPDYLLGYTAIGSPNIFRNSRLIPGSEKAYEVDVHETIHTNDEFETRVLTSWILDNDVNKYMFERGIVLKYDKEKIN
ncbi:hypothetical protein HN695_04675 [Candidatus Woesearchaeota archaeon]|jgi:hypothetical protein|nr:hypothetical protein [Candidatus Woesearchaeota archaeon]MBT5271871.1 hypothetical protein [Candidatus Woesearchaeota archaeon]MBT6041665.1 hypothetical protein [Candidatus Woesearchaeota archaeon]MBT6337359.1 hypothetical protein [Candidatus Woesearchaeota archaeon]MBT7927607.1 hypothetical protein [Candidatus Woesearchaeota archaeon]